MEKSTFLEALDIWGIKYADDVYEKFEIYTQNLLSYNEKVNLTAITNINEIYEKHYLDSLSILKYFQLEQNSSVIDVGTGAGFPSIPMKILREDIDLCMVDSLSKRVFFLEDMISKLSMKKATALHSRAEDLAQKKDYRENFDYAVSRAVANLSTLCEYCIPFVKKGGFLICLKGQNVDDEIQNSKNAMKLLNCSIKEKIDVEIPFSELKHNIIVIQKLGSTPKTYPRKSGTPSKNPL